MKEVRILKRGKVFVCPDAVADKAKQTRPEQKPSRPGRIQIPRGGLQGVNRCLGGVRIKWRS